MKRIIRIILSVAIVGTLPAYSQTQSDKVNDAVQNSEDQRENKIEILELKIQLAQKNLNDLKTELNTNWNGTARSIRKVTLIGMALSVTALVAGVKMMSTKSVDRFGEKAGYIGLLSLGLSIRTLIYSGIGTALAEGVVLISQSQADDLNRRIDESSIELGKLQNHLQKIRGT